MKKTLLLSAILLLCTVFVGCNKEKEPEPTYNNDLGGTVWRWDHETASTYYEILTFVSEKGVKATKNYFGIIGTYSYEYTYSNKDKKGRIVDWKDGDISKETFTISNNRLTMNDRNYYKQ